MLIDGDLFMEEVCDPNVEHAIREATSRNISRHRTTMELASYVDVALLLCTTMDGQVAYWPGTPVDRKLLVISYAEPRTDVVMIDAEGLRDEPHLVRVHKLSEFHMTGIIDWTLCHDAGTAEGPPLLSFHVDRSADPEPVEIVRLREALGVEDASRHFLTLKLALHVVQKDLVRFRDYPRETPSSRIAVDRH